MGSLITTFGSLVRLNVVDNLINVLNCISPNQVCVFILGFLIEQLRGLKLGLERLCIISSSQPDGKLLDLCLALSEILDEPDVSLLSVRHGLQHALGCLQYYIKQEFD